MSELIPVIPSPFTPIEGIDFVRNAYSIVGVSPTATQGEIDRARINKLADLHPDLRRENEEILAGQRHLVESAYAAIGTPERRRQYDEFLEQWKGPISHDGFPVFDPEFSAPRMLAQMLIRDARYLDYRVRLAEVEAQTTSQFQQSTFDVAGEFYRVESQQSDATLVLYKHMLGLKDLYLLLFEHALRDLVNADPDFVLTPSLDYAARSRASIERVRRSIERTVGYTFDLLYRAGQHLLLTEKAGVSPETSPAAEPDQEKVAAVATALLNFDKIATQIDKVAIEREKTIIQRLELVRGNNIQIPDAQRDKLILRFVIDGKVQHYHVVRDQKNVDEITNLDDLNTQDIGTVISYATQQGTHLIEVVHEDGLPLKGEIEYAAQNKLNALSVDQASE